MIANAYLLAGSAGRTVDLSVSDCHYTASNRSSGGTLTLYLTRRDEAERLLQAVSRALVLLDPSTPLSVASGVSPSAPATLRPSQEPEGGVSAGEMSALRMALVGDGESNGCSGGGAR